MTAIEIFINKKAERQLKKVPRYIQEALYAWVFSVEKLGLRQVRKISGFHDEPLKGSRKGQRSIRLSKSYRAIYTEDKNKKITFIEVIEVSKHEY